MIRTLIFIAVLMGSVILGTRINQESGYVLISMHNWSIESNLWIFILGIVFLILSCHLILIALHNILRSPVKFKQWKSQHASKVAQQITRQGLIELNEGYWEKAKKHLIKALPHAETPLLNYLSAARAAQEIGDNQLRDTYLRQAQQSMPEAQIAVELTQAQLQIANKQWEQALATLRHLQDIAPKHPYVLKLLVALYQEIGDWQQIIVLLPELQKHKIFSAEKFSELAATTYLQALRVLVQQSAAYSITDGIHSFVQNLPKSLKYDPGIMACYGCYLLKNTNYEQAAKMIQETLRKKFDISLIQIYGKIPSPFAKLSFAESLIKKQPYSAELYLCLAKLAAQDKLWGKAKSYLEQSIALKPSAEAFLILGNTYETLEDPAAAKEAYREGLSTVVDLELVKN